MARLVNHPVHISDREMLSSFIPFCSSGVAVSGVISSSFKNPVCDLFRERTLNGQVCYEADVDSYLRRHRHWDQNLEFGFNFIVDFNEEYDVKNLIPTTKPTERWPESSSTLYLQANPDQLFNIILKTISEYQSVMREADSLFSRPGPASAPWRGTLRAELHQTHFRVRGFRRTGSDGDTLSDGGVQSGLPLQEVQGLGPCLLQMHSLEPEITFRSQCPDLYSGRSGLCPGGQSGGRRLCREVPGDHHGRCQVQQPEGQGGNKAFSE